MKNRLKVFTLAVVTALMCMAMPMSAFAQDRMSMGNKNIVETAMADARFSMLVKALKEAGLVDTLKGAGPFTVFAPTNDAFAKVPADKLNMLMKDKAMLRSVLMYHVMSGRVTAGNARTMMAPMMGGSSASVKVADGMVMVDNARVVQADVMASNGVIHAIDMVLMPGMNGSTGMNSATGQNVNSNMSSNTTSGMGSNMNNGMMKMSSADQKFMMMAAMGGMAEVEMARLALQKSSNDSVKQYAQKMIDDHTKAGDELKQLASMKGVTLPMQPDAKQMAMMAKMQKLSGAEFDMMYVKEAGVKAHQDMEKLFMKESTGGKDMDAKSWAAKTLPTVRMHLQMARDMMMSMKGTGNGMSGMSSNRN
jgi:putative membrane protein